MLKFWSIIIIVRLVYCSGIPQEWSVWKKRSFECQSTSGSVGQSVRIIPLIITCRFENSPWFIARQVNIVACEC